MSIQRSLVKSVVVLKFANTTEEGHMCTQCEGSRICRICKSKRFENTINYACAIQEGYAVKRNYKTKELSMVEFITQHTDVDWVNDKTYDLGCKKLISDLGSHYRM